MTRVLPATRISAVAALERGVADAVTGSHRATVSSSGVPRNTIVPLDISATSRTRRAHVFHQVRRHDHARASDRRSRHQRAELDSLLGVEARGRLVEQQQFRVVHDRLSDADPVRSMPPDSARSFSFAWEPRSTVSIAAATAFRTRAGGTSLSSAKYSTNSTTVNPG